MNEFPPAGSLEKEIRDSAANAGNIEQGLETWNRTEGDYNHAGGNLNLREQQEMRNFARDTAANSERTANTLEEIAKNQRDSKKNQEETKLELEVIRREIKNL